MIDKIPRPVARRLAVYYRLLKEYSKKGEETISSSEMGKRLDLKPSQIRKDLSYFGGFGKRGTGYNVIDLMKTIEKIIGIDRTWNVLIIGAGKIGRALVNYPGLLQDGFIIKGIVDNNEHKVGLMIDEKFPVEDIRNIRQIIEKRNIDIGVICVPVESAQKVANLLIYLGIKGIVNFAPRTLEVPEDVMIEDVHISLSFKSLSFKMVNREK
jgi:redox-sensing transcriptional repressor